MRFKGRKTIVSDVTAKEMLDSNEVLCNVLNRSIGVHNQNKIEIDFLIDYRHGRQAILDKVKKIRPEINNKLVINHAQMITRNINGYFLGTPIQYIQSGYTEKKELIDELNRYVQYEDKASVDQELGEYQSICGTAYRIIYRDGEFADEVPFEDRSLNPSNTFVVYNNDISQRPLLGVTYHKVHDDNNKFQGMRYYVYSDFGRYDILTQSTNPIKPSDIVNFTPYNVGGVPIIEYPNNIWRIGDWELMIELMDAINALHSGRLDDIDQVIQSLLVFINADIDEKVYDEMRDNGIVSLINTTGNKTEVKSIGDNLDQTGMNMFAKELEDLLYALVGIPSRNDRPGGGGDTGQAVELRDGWADLEIIAKNKELTFKKSEKRTLKIILNIFNIGRTEKLSLLDVDIKFSRNKNNNLLVKTQSYSMLLSTKTLTPADCLTIVDLVSDVNDYISRGEQFWGDDFANRNSNSGLTNEEGVTFDKGDEIDL